MADPERDTTDESRETNGRNSRRDSENSSNNESRSGTRSTEQRDGERLRQAREGLTRESEKKDLIVEPARAGTTRKNDDLGRELQQISYQELRSREKDLEAEIRSAEEGRTKARAEEELKRAREEHAIRLAEHQPKVDFYKRQLEAAGRELGQNSQSGLLMLEKINDKVAEENLHEADRNDINEGLIADYVSDHFSKIESFLPESMRSAARRATELFGRGLKTAEDREEMSSLSEGYGYRTAPIELPPSYDKWDREKKDRWWLGTEEFKDKPSGRDLVWGILADEVDRGAGVSPEQLFYTHGWNKLMVSVRDMPQELVDEIAAWRSIYIANLSAEADAEHLLSAMAGMWEALHNLSGGIGKNRNDHVDAVTLALAKLDARYLDYMRLGLEGLDDPDVSDKTPNPDKWQTTFDQAQRRDAIRFFVAREIEKQYGFPPGRGKFYVRQAERIWLISGLKGQRDQVVEMDTVDKQKWTGRYGRNATLDQEFLTRRDIRPSDIYKFKGNVPPWIRRVFGEGGASVNLATEDVRAWLPTLLDHLSYKKGGFNNLFTQYFIDKKAGGISSYTDEKGGPIKQYRRLKGEEIEKHEKEVFEKLTEKIDYRNKAGLDIKWGTQAKAAYDIRGAVVNREKGILNFPSLANVAPLVPKFAAIDDSPEMGAISGVLEGLLAASTRKNIFERIAPHFVKLPEEESVTPDNKRVKNKKMSTVTFGDSEVNLSTGLKYPTYDRAQKGDAISRADYLDYSEKKRLQRKINRLHIPFAPNVTLIDPVTNKPYEERSFLEGYRPVRLFLDLKDTLISLKPVGFFGGFFGAMFGHLWANLFTGLGGGGGGKKK